MTIASAVMTKLGFSDAHIIEGSTTTEQRAAHEAEVLQGRILAAQRNSRWHEVEETALVPRGRWFVEADSDVVLQPTRGVVFAPSSATAIADNAELWFTVSDEGQLAFYEPVPGVSSWTEHLEARAARERDRTAPKPRPAWTEPQT